MCAVVEEGDPSLHGGDPHKGGAVRAGNVHAVPNNQRTRTARAADGGQRG